VSARREPWLRFAAAVACPVLATVAGSAWPQASETFPVILYLLAVVGAAVLAGLRGGLVASFLSFLGLNFFFTPPVGTFAVEKGEDFVALFGFLAVSSLVATLLTKSVAERKRAERQEHEAWRLYQLSSRLLGGAKLRDVLQHLAQELVQLFDLASCEVTAHTDEAEGPLSASFPRSAPGAPSMDGSIEIPLATDRQDLGMVVLFPKQDHVLTPRDRELAGTFVGQVALALERSRLEEATRKAQADVDASRMRAALFSSVTHDLRTPLASIKAAATSLLEEGVLFDAAQRMDLLQTITEESDRLNRLIGNLLDLSRLRAGALVPARTPTPIDDVVEAVVRRLRKLLANHPVRVRVREDIPPVPVDLIQIDQVLSNLLENAVRYTPAGTEIEIRAARWHSWVEIQVADRGPGIPVENRERVLEDFYRQEVGAAPGGAGLGLSITRAIVVAHGGSISINETPGGGTTVAFRLPLLEAE
jgi:two-component system, OmpR family, sensor histidine kinase KdpD